MIIPINQQDQSIPINSPINQTGISPGRATMLLISPRKTMQNHFHRPLSMNFSHGLFESLAENVIDRPSIRSVDSIMSSNPEINRAIIPSQRGYLMNTSRYKDYWWFVLVVDENTNGITHSKLASRFVYIGMCEGEPISHSGMISATPEKFINPNCGLIVTRSFTMKKYGTLGARGPMETARTFSDTEHVRYNEDVFASPVNVNDNYFNMLPKTLRNAVTISDNPGEGMTTLLDQNDALNIKRYDKIPASFESPRMFMKNIIRSVSESSRMFNTGDSMGGFALDDIDSTMDPGHRFESCLTSQIEQNQSLETYNNNSNEGPLSKGFTTLGVIFSRYQPKLGVVNVQPNHQMDILPQDMTSPQTIFSSLVCATIPTYMNQIGLSAVSFMYNSPNQAWQVHHIESSIECSQEELQHKWNSFQVLLTMDLFPVLLSNTGPFDLSVFSNINGTTDCVLNLLDYAPLPPGAVYREDTSLGGMISPLIGTGSQILHNSAQMNGLFHNLSDYAAQQVPTYF